MVTKTVLMAEDVAAMLGGVFEYNRRGLVAGVAFYGADHQLLPVAYVEVIADEPPLTVRSKPEDDKGGGSASAAAYGIDPRLVPGPLTANELSTLTEQAHRG